MNDFYVKSEDGEFVPVSLDVLLPNNIANGLMIVTIGKEGNIPNMESLEAVTNAFVNAPGVVNNNLDILSITPDIDVSVFTKEDALEKNVYLRVVSGAEDVSLLDESVRYAYDVLKDKHPVVVLPTPLTVKEYNNVKSILKRSDSRRRRRHDR